MFAHLEKARVGSEWTPQERAQVINVMHSDIDEINRQIMETTGERSAVPFTVWREKKEFILERIRFCEQSPAWWLEQWRDQFSDYVTETI